MVEVTFW